MVNICNRINPNNNSFNNTNLNKIINNITLDSSTLHKLSKSGLIKKITYSQYVITKEGLEIINQNN